MSANPEPTGRVEAERQSLIAFHLTGRRPDAGLDAVDGAGACPALLARYRDLTTLRYDFPLVLALDPAGKNYVQCLSALIDGVVREIARDDDGERVTRHLLRLEREIRALLATGVGGSLPELWDAAAGRLAAQADDLLKNSLTRARAALKTDGKIVDCDKAMPARLIAHAWRLAQEMKARETGDTIERLAQKLSDIVRADFARAPAGRSAESLKAAVGTAYAEVFDFEAMSRVLARGAGGASLPKRRRERIQSVLSVLGSQRFFPVAGAAGGKDTRTQGYPFTFDSCAGALAAYRERQPAAIELARAIAIASLETEGEYNEAKHDALFAQFGKSGLGQEELARFPDYFIHVSADQLQAAESERLAEMLSAGLPVKILLQTDDLVGESPVSGDARLAPAMRSKQLASAAIAMTDVYVLQSCSSNLFQFRDRILRGMTYSGPALFSVFSGATGDGSTLPPYLTAAAAMESRVFPAYTYDPSAGPNWASRFDLAANSQADLDWPVQRFDYEGDGGQRITQDIAFTLIEFLACDPRHAAHFACVPRAKWTAGMVPAGDYLAMEPGDLPDKVPCVLIVDGNGRLHKAIVDDKLVRAAQRCRESWHSLQELAGIHNSHAERLLARESKLREERERKETEARAKEVRPAGEATASAAVPAPGAVAAAAAAAEEKRSPDEPSIETARCTTCNECTQINDRMFAYNENKQAYIANPDAGTYRQMVEAAESCQVSIIHPGKPRNPNEPGLDELVKRAEPFL